MGSLNFFIMKLTFSPSLLMLCTFPIVAYMEDIESSFQERHKLMIAPKTESCFFLANLQEGYKLSVSYLVISSKNGKQQDITMRLRDPKKMLVTYQGRRSTGNYSDYVVKTQGDFELCFNNRHSMADSKKLVWQFDIEGDEDVVQPHEEVDLAVNQTLQDYLVEAAMVRKSILKVRGNVARSRHTQWWLGNKTPKDTERLESIVRMIDTWSIVYSGLVCVVGLAQVVILKKLFVEMPASSNLKVKI